MKKIIITTIIGLMASGSVFAAGQYSNQDQRTDLTYGYHKPAASPSEPAVNDGRFSNQDQRTDLTYGYHRPVASSSEPPVNDGRFSNQDQRTDITYGYK